MHWLFRSLDGAARRNEICIPYTKPIVGVDFIFTTLSQAVNFALQRRSGACKKTKDPRKNKLHIFAGRSGRLAAHPATTAKMHTLFLRGS
jgi:hypothetical protein